MEKLKYSLLFMISILAISNRWVSANDIDDERNRIYNSSYSGKYNNRIAFPIGELVQVCIVWKEQAIYLICQYGIDRKFFMNRECLLLCM